MNRPLFLVDCGEDNEGEHAYDVRAGDAVTGPILLTLAVRNGRLAVEAFHPYNGDGYPLLMSVSWEKASIPIPGSDDE
jgi:hypothetical protein